jgi:phosphate transport system substrate-binding protein
MKRALCLGLAIAFSLTICGCVTKDDKDTTQVDTTKIVETTVPEKTAETTEPVQTKDSLANLPITITLENYPVVDGSTATIPLAIGLIQKVTGCTEAEAEESIAFNTTDASYYALHDGTSELLLVYAPAQPTIDELAVFNTMDIREIGLDALVFIVNEDNPIDSLTSDQIRDIYSGKITNWSEVGGDDLEIVAFQRPELSGSQTLMLNLMMQETVMMEPTIERIASGMSDIIEDIASYNNSGNAIGYSVYYYAKNMYVQPGLKFIAVDGVLPSNETINSREYGLINPFYGIIPFSPNPLAEAILDWLQTEEGQQLLVDCGYVPIMQMN